MAVILAAARGPASVPRMGRSKVDWVQRVRAQAAVTCMIAGLLAACFLGSSAQASSPDERADRLLAQMTQPEKLTLLHGVFAAYPDQPRPAGAIGSAGFVRGVARLGIPDLQETDAGLGVTNPQTIRPGDTAVALPSGLAVAASFDPDTAYRVGAALGREASSRGFNVVLGGGANLVRDPRGGRQFEYAGEDPLLTGVMIGAAVRGIQDQGVVATVKHFAVNDQETGRSLLSADLPEADLRESDLLAFEIAIEQGHPGAVMCGYNRVNTVYDCANADLLTNALKRDWRYPGWVMSDWGAVHGVGAINAGLDQESGEQFDSQIFFGAPLAQALATGQVKQARIDDAVHRILRSLIAAGALDHARAAKPNSAIDLAAARSAEARGIVLMVNHGLVPLARTLRRVCVIGAQADAGVPAGGGSSQVTPIGGYARQIPTGIRVEPAYFGTQVFDPPSPLSRIQAKLPSAQILFDDGENPTRAARLAKTCDAVIVFAQQFAGEEIDVPDLSLPGSQNALLQAVTDANPKTVVVLETAGAVTMPWLAKAGAVIEAWYPGNGGAEAIADILFGDAAPSGRLPVTFPAREADLPNPALPGAGLPPGTPFRVHYPEGANVGYRWFAAKALKPLFPFGFGLSNTSFVYANLHVTGGAAVKAEFDIRNIGTHAGAAVPQLYLMARHGLPVLRFIGWRRQWLRPGETQHVVVGTDMRLLADFDPGVRRWRVTAGNVEIGLGENAGDIRVRAVASVDSMTLTP